MAGLIYGGISNGDGSETLRLGTLRLGISDDDGISDGGISDGDGGDGTRWRW